MTDTEQKALAVTTAELIEKLERAEPYAGCYSLHLYCDHSNPAHEFREFPHEYCAETGSACRASARAEGWRIHKDRTATCPKCIAALKAKEADNGKSC